MLCLDHVTIQQTDFHLTAHWSVEPGTRLALIGPSGAGKSTLLLTIAGFVAPTAGRILWGERDITHLPPAQRPVAMLFQDQNLFPHLTLTQNLGLALSPDLALTAAEQAKVAAMLDRLGLSGLHQRRPGDLSGGQMARAALGRAMLQSRPVLLLDEPFAALGPGLKANLMALVADLAAEAGTTVLLVTHDPTDARRFAPETVLVAEGRADSPTNTATLLDTPPPALRAYLG